MTPRRGAALAAAAAAAALVLAGCSGGGGGGDDAADAAEPAPPPVTTSVATGAGPGESASLAIAALGHPGSVDPARSGQSVAGYETFGAPHDLFVVQVPDGPGGSREPSGTPAAPEDPYVAVPDAAGSIPIPPNGTSPAPADEPPVQTPRAMEADFDISGEPVVAREGDAIPPDTQQFIVDTIGAKEVVLILSGGLLPDGTNRLTLARGESLTLRNTTAGRTYRLKLVDIRVV